MANTMAIQPPQDDALTTISKYVVAWLAGIGTLWGSVVAYLKLKHEKQVAVDTLEANTAIAHEAHIDDSRKEFLEEIKATVNSQSELIKIYQADRDKDRIEINDLKAELHAMKQELRIAIDLAATERDGRLKAEAQLSSEKALIATIDGLKGKLDEKDKIIADLRLSCDVCAGISLKNLDEKHDGTVSEAIGEALKQEAVDNIKRGILP